jgi:hypothetical protein
MRAALLALLLAAAAAAVISLLLLLVATHLRARALQPERLEPFAAQLSNADYPCTVELDDGTIQPLRGIRELERFPTVPGACGVKPVGFEDGLMDAALTRCAADDKSTPYFQPSVVSNVYVGTPMGHRRCMVEFKRRLPAAAFAQYEAHIRRAVVESSTVFKTLNGLHESEKAGYAVTMDDKIATTEKLRVTTEALKAMQILYINKKAEVDAAIIVEKNKTAEKDGLENVLTGWKLRTANANSAIKVGTEGIAADNAAAKDATEKTAAIMQPVASVIADTRTQKKDRNTCDNEHPGVSSTLATRVAYYAAMQMPIAKAAVRGRAGAQPENSLADPEGGRWWRARSDGVLVSSLFDGVDLHLRVVWGMRNSASVGGGPCFGLFDEHSRLNVATTGDGSLRLAAYNPGDPRRFMFRWAQGILASLAGSFVGVDPSSTLFPRAVSHQNTRWTPSGRLASQLSVRPRSTAVELSNNSISMAPWGATNFPAGNPPARWVWNRGDAAVAGLPVESYWFVGCVFAPNDVRVPIHVKVDNSCEVWVDGVIALSFNGWGEGPKLLFLNGGMREIGIKATNAGGPGGLLANIDALGCATGGDWVIL